MQKEKHMNNQSLLDEMVSEDSIEMLKAALPYLPLQGQSFISVFAKFLELRNTLQLFHSAPDTAEICIQSREKNNPLEMLSACSSVCHGRTKEQLDNMIQALTMFQLFELSQKSGPLNCSEKEATIHE